MREGYGKSLKERLDVLLVNRGFFESRERAKASIMAGTVYVDGQISDKPGTKIPEDACIEVRESGCPYVSRGGYKLEKALSVFSLDLTDAVCLDIGASTGGFTDCMLQNGAAKVFAADVGYGQLAWKLRSDPRVVNIERCNVRYLKPEEIGEKVDFISIDVSFISLRHMFPVARQVLKDDGEIVCLVKPQFEAGREEMKNSKGIVRDPAVHEETILRVIGYAEEQGLSACGLSFSPVTGAKGNIEFLLHLASAKMTVGNTSEKGYNTSINVKSIVENAHQELSR